MSRSVLRLAAAVPFLLPTAALAHTGVGATGGLLHGFMHPIGGLDHVLAMVAVGLLAAHLGGRALWLVPASFVALMAAGGLFGVAGLGLPLVETGIALSVVGLGLAVALRLGLPTATAMALVGGFAAFHGVAHGAEMPAAAAGLAYGLGFMAATASLHALGIGLAFVAERAGRAHGALAIRAGGGAMALAGVGLLTGIL